MTYKDKTEDGHPQKVESREAITLAEFTDRVYQNAPNTCLLNGMYGGKGIIKILYSYIQFSKNLIKDFICICN